MRGRDRLFGTVAIWFAVAVMLNTVIDRFLRFSADFNGLWPNISFFGSQGPMTEADFLRLQEIQDQANQLSQTLMAQVNQSIATQMAANLPFLVVLALALILAATLSTYFVWRNAYGESEGAPQAKGAVSASKSKRGSRVEQVVKALDDNELAELRARLEAADAEAVSLEDLLWAERHTREHDT